MFKQLFFALYLVIVILGTVNFIRDGHPFMAMLFCLPALMIVFALFPLTRELGAFALWHEFGPLKPEKQENETNSHFHLKTAMWWFFCFLVALFPMLLGLFSVTIFNFSKEKSEMVFVACLFITFLLGIPCLLKSTVSLARAAWHAFKNQ